MTLGQETRWAYSTKLPSPHNFTTGILTHAGTSKNYDHTVLYMSIITVSNIFKSPGSKGFKGWAKKINTKVKMDRFFIGIKKTSHRSIKH